MHIAIPIPALLILPHELSMVENSLASLRNPRPSSFGNVYVYPISSDIISVAPPSPDANCAMDSITRFFSSSSSSAGTRHRPPSFSLTSDDVRRE